MLKYCCCYENPGYPSNTLPIKVGKPKDCGRPCLEKHTIFYQKSVFRQSIHVLLLTQRQLVHLDHQTVLPPPSSLLKRIEKSSLGNSLAPLPNFLFRTTQTSFWKITIQYQVCDCEVAYVQSQKKTFLSQTIVNFKSMFQYYLFSCFDIQDLCFKQFQNVQNVSFFPIFSTQIFQVNFTILQNDNITIS